MSVVAGAALALIGFVLTQGILKFVIEPIQEQRRLIGEVAHALSTILDVPEDREDVDREEIEEIRKETRKTLRSLSGRLWASLWSIPFYDAFALVGLVPRAKNVTRAASELTIWSYFLSSPSDVGTFVHLSKDIAGLLGIKHGLEIAFSDSRQDAGESD
jgi:hypothetical protein